MSNSGKITATFWNTPAIATYPGVPAHMLIYFDENEIAEKTDWVSE